MKRFLILCLPLLLISKPLPLSNCGNTCYLNACIQALYASDPLRNLLISQDNVFRDPKTIAVPTKGELSEAQLKKIQTDYYKACLPYPFTKLIQAMHQVSIGVHAEFLLHLKEFAQYAGLYIDAIAHGGARGQQDASEFLDGLLDALVHEAKELSTSNPHADIVYSALQQIFSLATQQVVICPDKKYENQLNATDIKYLPLTAMAHENPSFIQALQEAFDSEDVDYQLDTWKKSERCKKYTRLKRLPGLFIMSLNRINPGSSIQPLFNFSIQVNDVTHIDPNGPEYNLGSTIIQFGGRAGGHYIALVRDGSTWYSCDDAQITVVTKPAEPLAKGYIYFYTKSDFSIAQPEPMNPPIAESHATSPPLPRRSPRKRPAPESDAACPSEVKKKVDSQPENDINPSLPPTLPHRSPAIPLPLRTKADLIDDIRNDLINLIIKLNELDRALSRPKKVLHNNYNYLPDPSGKDLLDFSAGCAA